MPSELDAAASVFSEQAKKHQIALYYTMGDQEKAKKMVNNAYTDLYVIKCSFSSSSVYGALLIFLNTSYLKAVHAHILVTRSFDLVDIKTTRDWRSFERQLVDIAKKGDHDEMFSNQFKDNLLKGLTIQEISNLAKLLEQNNGIAINHFLQKFVSTVTGLQNMELSADYEQISSLSMELHSVTSIKIQQSELATGDEAKQNVENIKVEPQDDALQGKEVKLVLNGALILSPIKGKDISSLAVGDRIMVSIVDKNPRAIDVAKAFNAYDSEKGIRPISGRIISLKHDEVYTIFTIVAKGIFIKIVEEESSIKIAMDPAYYAGDGKKESESSISGLTLIILAVVFLVLVGIVVLFIMKL